MSIKIGQSDLRFSIKKRPNKFINATIWKQNTFHWEVSEMAKFTILTPLSLLISCKHSVPLVGLKMSSLFILALRSPNRIFV
jgi:hypothetical protein